MQELLFTELIKNIIKFRLKFYDLFVLTTAAIDHDILLNLDSDQRRTFMRRLGLNTALKNRQRRI